MSTMSLFSDLFFWLFLLWFLWQIFLNVQKAGFLNFIWKCFLFVCFFFQSYNPCPHRKQKKRSKCWMTVEILDELKKAYLTKVLQYLQCSWILITNQNPSFPELWWGERCCGERGDGRVFIKENKREKTHGHGQQYGDCGVGRWMQVEEGIEGIMVMGKNRATLKIVTDKSQGSKFVKGFGRIGGILRYPVDF